jgi:hypothetical protein
MATPKEGYRVKDGTKVPGTTTIIGRFKESGALIQWAWKRGKDFPNEPLYESRDAAGDVGTQIHEMIEACVRNQPLPDMPAGMKREHADQANSGFAAFTRWAEGMHLEIAPVEVPLVCECHRFGGTPDAIAVEKDDTLSLLDWKSSKSFYFDNLIQLAAYQHLWNVNRPDQPITGNIHVVRFGKDGADFEHRSFPLAHPKLAKAFRMFELYREAYDLDKFLTGKN